MDSNRKRILFVSHTAAITGPTQSLSALLPHLTGRYEVSVLTPDEGPLCQWLAQAGIPAYRIPDRGGISITETARLLRNKKIDLLYGNNPNTYTRNALIAARLAGRPAIWHFRSVKWHWDWRDGIFLRLANRVIAVSQACAEPLTRFTSSENIRVIYNGVEAAKFQVDPHQARQYLQRQAELPPDAKILLSVGHLRPGKGQAQQVEVMRQLALHRPNVHLVMIGSLTNDPEYAAELRRMIAQNDLEDRIHLLGLRDDVPLMLAGADIYIHTSQQEAHPRSIIEAMAAGLPVVSYAVGGVRETVIDNQTGCLIEYGDFFGMSQAIASILDSPQLSAAFGEQGRQHVQQHFTADSTALQIERVLQELLKGNPN